MSILKKLSSSLNSVTGNSMIADNLIELFYSNHIKAEYGAAEKLVCPLVVG